MNEYDYLRNKKNDELTHLFEQACLLNNMQIIKDLFENRTNNDIPNIKTAIKPKYHGNRALIKFTENGNLELIKYLFTSPKIKRWIDVHTENDHAIKNACKYGHLDIVKYLLTSPDLKEHADISAQNYLAFTSAQLWGKRDILTYLIIDYGLEEEIIIEHMIEPVEFVNHLLNLKNLNKNLNHNLKSSPNSIIKRAKI